MSFDDASRRERVPEKPSAWRGWTHVQRREARTVLHWLDCEERLRTGFEDLATALRATLRRRVRTASDARAVWRAAPAVLGKCNDLETYQLPLAETAFAWLHFLDRYVRTWLSLEHLLRLHVLPMGRNGVRALDVGTGPGPSAFATHDFYVAIRDYAQVANAPNWDQPPNITYVESAPTMNLIRSMIGEYLGIKRPARTTLAMTSGPHDFETFQPTRERRRLEKVLRDESYEYFNEERQEWDADPVYTAQEANREANRIHRYRLFTLSNFLTTPETFSTFQANLEGILADAHAGTVLLIIGGRGGNYPTVYELVAGLAEAAGFRRHKRIDSVNSADAKLEGRLDEELRWFYRHIRQRIKTLPVDEWEAARICAEFESDKRISFGSSAVHAFRK